MIFIFIVLKAGALFMQLYVIICFNTLFCVQFTPRSGVF
jgi:hypothetical protein